MHPATDAVRTALGEIIVHRPPFRSSRTSMRTWSRTRFDEASSRRSNVLEIGPRDVLTKLGPRIAGDMTFDAVASLAAIDAISLTAARAV
jgi:hypothetical protein